MLRGANKGEDQSVRRMMHQAVKIALSETPTELHLHELMTAASEKKGTLFSCSFPKGHEEYSLSLIYLEQLGGMFEWRMYANSKELWFHLTTDVMLILSMLQVVLGEEPKHNQAEQGKTHARLPPVKDPNKKNTPSHSQKFSLSKAPVQDLTATFDTIPIYMSEQFTQRQEHLTGSLDLVHVTNLLQSVSLGQMTGRLRIQRPVASVDIYFDGGIPVHAAGTHSTGDECVLQVICWKTGQFHFEPNVTTNEKTINQGINSLMLQGVQLSDNTEFLKRAGVSMQSVLTRVHEKIAEIEFEQLMRKSEPVDMALLKAFYLRVQPGRTLQELLSQLNFQRSQWVQIVANLIRCDAIRLDKVVKREHLKIKPKAINTGLFESISNIMLDRETKLLTYEALLFLLEQEFKCTKPNTFSLILFDVSPIRVDNRGESPKSPKFVKELADRIRQVFNGYLTHYEKHELALFLPGVEISAAAQGAEAIKTSLLSAVSLAGIEPSNLSIGIGLATYPDDVNDIGSLLAAAERARSEAKKQGCAIVLARDL
ncbi:hypothetical protein BH10CYA1_BH10CYA1_24800 [soil metagenome]